jgi:hypothetical protein
VSIPLRPDIREPLLEALRPEPGFSLDAAVGTSYSLDLDALLLAPLSFALLDTDGEPDVPTLLAALSSYAGRIALYCDAARIAPPRHHQALYGVLERTIHPVRMPSVPGRRCSFHPKLWVLRFRHEDGTKAHRVLCLTRNLTFDRSWDTLLRLDEDLETGQLLAGLSGFLRELDRRVPSSLVRSLVRSAARARFEPPPGVDRIRLHAFTGEGSHDPLAGRRARSLLVVSPFVSRQRLATLAQLADRPTLVSRPRSLDELGAEALARYRPPLVLHAEATSPSEEDMEEKGEPLASSGGLHAKLYVLDDGSRATWFTGSANATDAAVERNLEVLVELEGPSRQLGTKALLRSGEDPITFGRLLREYVPQDEPLEPTREELERERLEAIRDSLAAHGLLVRAREAKDGWWLHLALGQPAAKVLGPRDALFARAATEPGRWERVDRNARAAARLTVSTPARVTGLIAFELRGPEHGIPPLGFVLRGRLEGAPPDRDSRLFLELLPDAERILRLLFLLLAEGRHDEHGAALARRLLARRGHEASADSGWELRLPLFESLVRAFARDPRRLVAIDRVVRTLEQTEGGRERLPPGFLEIWSSFRAVIPVEER